MTRQQIVDQINRDPDTLFTRKGSLHDSRFKFTWGNGNIYFPSRNGTPYSELLVVRYYPSKKIISKESGEYDRNIGRNDSSYYGGIGWELYEIAPEYQSKVKVYDPEFNLKKMYSEYIFSEDYHPTVSFDDFKEDVEDQVDDIVERLKVLRDTFSLDTVNSQLEDSENDAFYRNLHSATQKFGCNSNYVVSLMNLVVNHFGDESEQVDLKDYKGFKKITLNLPEQPVICVNDNPVSGTYELTITSKTSVRLATDEELKALAINRFSEYTKLLTKQETDEEDVSESLSN